MFFGRSKVKLQLNVGGPNIQPHPDGAKVTTAEPFRFRLSYGATIDPGVDTFMMTRADIDKLQQTILVELAAQGATVSAGAEEMVNNTISRVEEGTVRIIKGIQSVRRLTNPDILMLVDMKQNSDYYVPNKSAFFNQFKALADKVLDLSFCALAFGAGDSVKGHNFAPDEVLNTVTNFVKHTGEVTRGMDQFTYDIPNIAYTSPYVNFSVRPNDANYSQARFPKRFNRATEQLEKIPKTDFQNTYLFYVNELFNTYKRYLRLIGYPDRLAPIVNAPVEAAVLDGDDDDLIRGQALPKGKSKEEVEQSEAEEGAEARRNEQLAEAERQRVAVEQARLAAESGSSSSSEPSKDSDPLDPSAGGADTKKDEESDSDDEPASDDYKPTLDENEAFRKYSNLKSKLQESGVINSNTDYSDFGAILEGKTAKERKEILDSTMVKCVIRSSKDAPTTLEERIFSIGELIELDGSKHKPKDIYSKPTLQLVEYVIKKFESKKHVTSSKLAKKYNT